MGTCAAESSDTTVWPATDVGHCNDRGRRRVSAADRLRRRPVPGRSCRRRPVPATPTRCVTATTAAPTEPCPAPRTDPAFRHS